MNVVDIEGILYVSCALPPQKKTFLLYNKDTAL